MMSWDLSADPSQWGVKGVEDRFPRFALDMPIPRPLITEPFDYQPGKASACKPVNPLWSGGFAFFSPTENPLPKMTKGALYLTRPWLTLTKLLKWLTQIELCGVFASVTHYLSIDLSNFAIQTSPSPIHHRLFVSITRFGNRQTRSWGFMHQLTVNSPATCS